MDAIPLWQVCPATYADARGTEQTCIFNDGDTLAMEVRGVLFRGGDFDGLRPAPETSPALRAQFTLNRDALCGCTITCDLPQVVTTPERHVLGTLRVEVRLGLPDARGGIDAEQVHLELAYGGRTLASRHPQDLFEGALLAIQKQLPAGHYLVNCFGCAYADYFYGGQGLFGSMACFRACKAEYLAVRSKDDFIRVWDKNAGGVQETAVCPEFAPRRPGTGYRG